MLQAVMTEAIHTDSLENPAFKPEMITTMDNTKAEITETNKLIKTFENINHL